MKLIPLTQNKFAEVDDIDYPILNKYKWYAKKDKMTYYAGTGAKTILMHNFIMNNKSIDHIDGNGLNNQRNNLRIVTNQQNCMNRSPYKGKITKGVNWHNRDQRWFSVIRFNGHNIWLGFSNTRKEAQEVYNAAAIKYFGQFAHIIDTTPILD